MKRTLVIEVSNHLNEKVMLQGYVHKVRKLSKVTFIILRDRSGLIQCVIDNKAFEVKGLKLESVVEFIGTVGMKYGNEKEFELILESIKVLSKVEEDLPIEINKVDLEVNIDTLLNNRALSLRNLKINAVFKIQASLVQAFSAFLIEQSFTQVFTPKIVSEGTEGGTQLFEIKYFEKRAYMAQSPQFYKQMLVGSGFERVFEIGHVYRAEEHNTLRHLNEYVSLDLEMGFIADEEELMDLETELLKFMFNYVNETCFNELEVLGITLPIINGSVPRMKLSEAITILKDNYKKKELDMDLDPEGERLICEYVKEKYNSDFIFLTHYPQKKRPMYAMPAEEGLTHSFDLLFRGLEITTGGQRIHDFKMLKERMVSRELNPEAFEDYLTVFKFGMPPHGGLAIGLERLTAQLLGYKNVRETTLFPRDRDRLRP